MWVQSRGGDSAVEVEVEGKGVVVMAVRADRAGWSTLTDDDALGQGWRLPRLSLQGVA